MKFFQEIQVEMEISVQIFQFIILFCTPKRETTKTMKSNSVIKSNLSLYLNDI